MSSKSQKKVIKSKEQVIGNKQPKIAYDPDSYLDESPVWCFSKHDTNHARWSFSQCNGIYSKIITKLISFERMTWNQIRIADRDNNHFVSISGMIREARKRAKELKLDYDELFSLRLEGKLRLYGFIEGKIFYIIWYDPEHEIYPCEKKHT